MEGATHFGTCGCRGEGPYVEIWLDIEGDTIKRAAYRTPGCPSSIAAASVACQIITARTREQALRLNPEDLLLILGGLPEGKEPFATMSVTAVEAALASASHVAHSQGEVA
jgi:NifU-like protein involved in Fe-S cluster formation